MPAVLVEAGFINSDIDNELFDTKFNQTAQAIADGINETIKLAGLSATSETVKTVNDYYGYEMEVPAFAEDSYRTNNNPNGGMPPETSNGTDMQNGDMQNNEMRSRYQILVGIFRSLASAQYNMSSLSNLGYYTTIFEDDGLYQVRVGDYGDIEEALIAQRELRDRGYQTLIVRAE